MTHEKLCERARRWLSGTRRCEPVFSNIASCQEIPDAIGWSSCYGWAGSTVVECKTSRSDFHADRRKYLAYEDPNEKWKMKWKIPMGRVSPERAKQCGYRLIEYPRMGDFRYFMCESGVLPVDLMEKHCPDHGLLYVEGRRVRIVRPAPRRIPAMIDKDGEIRYLRFSIINRKNPYQIDSLFSEDEMQASA